MPFYSLSPAISLFTPPAFQDDKAQGDIQGNGSKNLLQVSGRAVFVPEGETESWDQSPFFLAVRSQPIGANERNRLDEEDNKPI